MSHTITGTKNRITVRFDGGQVDKYVSAWGMIFKVNAGRKIDPAMDACIVFEDGVGSVFTLRDGESLADGYERMHEFNNRFEA